MTATDETSATSIANTDALVPMRDVSVNISSHKKLRVGKMMDFRTPKALKTQTPKNSSRKKAPTMQNLITVCADIVQIVPQKDIILSPPRQTSTPDPGHQMQRNIVHVEATPNITPIPTRNEDRIQALDSPAPQHAAEPGSTQHSVRKRSRDQVDIEVPLKTSPQVAKKRKLRGLLRELGAGASRFVIDAPNFATPARRKSIAFTRLRLNAAGRQSRRISSRLQAMVVEAAVPSRQSVAKRGRTTLLKVVKSCVVCLGKKAWNRWHPAGEGLWNCNKCHKRPQCTGNEVSTVVSQRASTRGRAAYSLSEQDVILILLRRREGCAFDAIARELDKWKTGQSVKIHFEKALRTSNVEMLEAEVARFQKESSPQESSSRLGTAARSPGNPRTARLGRDAKRTESDMAIDSKRAALAAVTGLDDLDILV